jgi:hypothetical protein
MKYHVITLSLILCIGQAAAQTPLSINTKNHCSFLSKTWEEELYRFDDNALVEKWVNEILNYGGTEKNFTLMQSNVESVAAVVDNGKRYLFYSLDFVHKTKDAVIFAALAHEIGHHFFKHSLNGQFTLTEESEAYFFMGYILSKKGISKADVEQLALNNFKSKAEDQNDYIKAVLDGFEKATCAIQLEGLAYEGGPELNKLTLPTFEFKKCYAIYNLPKPSFAQIKTLGGIDEHLRRALDKQGFTRQSYFSVKNGFALVTQMEQYNAADASSRNDRTRWLEYPARDNFSGVMDYLMSIVMPNKGHFRLFVFVVTNDIIKASNSRVSKKEAAEWLGQGGNILPKALKMMPYTEGYNVSALVYEFEVPQSNHVPKQICPITRFDAQTHLLKAGIKF